MNEIIKRAIGKLQVSFLAQLSEEEQITILQHKLQTLYDATLSESEFRKLSSSDIFNVLLLLQHGIFYFEYCSTALGGTVAQIEAEESATNATITRLERQLLRSKEQLRDRKVQLRIEKESLSKYQAAIKKCEPHRCYFCDKLYRNEGDWEDHLRVSHAEELKPKDDRKLLLLNQNVSMQQQMATLLQHQSVMRDNLYQVKLIEHEKGELQGTSVFEGVEMVKQKQQHHRDFQRAVEEYEQQCKAKTWRLLQEQDYLLQQQMLIRQAHLLEERSQYQSQLDELEMRAAKTQQQQMKKQKNISLMKQRLSISRDPETLSVRNSTEAKKSVGNVKKSGSQVPRLQKLDNEDIQESVDENAVSPSKPEAVPRKPDAVPKQSDFLPKQPDAFPKIEIHLTAKSDQASSHEEVTSFSLRKNSLHESEHYSQMARDYCQAQIRRIKRFDAEQQKYFTLTLQILKNRTIGKHAPFPEASQMLEFEQVEDKIEGQVGIKLDEAELDDLQFYLDEMRDLNKDFKYRKKAPALEDLQEEDAKIKKHFQKPRHLTRVKKQEIVSNLSQTDQSDDEYTDEQASEEEEELDQVSPLFRLRQSDTLDDGIPTFPFAMQVDESHSKNDTRSQPIQSVSLAAQLSQTQLSAREQSKIEELNKVMDLQQIKGYGASSFMDMF